MFFRTREPTALERACERAIRELNNHPIGSEDYLKTLEVVIKLHGLMEKEKPSSVSRDTLTIVGGNLLGIVMILKHEWANPITSRAMNLLLRPRV
jgi:hypothetical protein